MSILQETDERKQSDKQAWTTEVIRSSPLFDEAWYRRNQVQELPEEVDAAQHYLTEGSPHLDPSPYFHSEEYLSLNLDVLRAGMNPLLHYELYGRESHRLVSYHDIHEIVYPEDAKECKESYEIRAGYHRRTCVLACFTSDGRISDSLIFLIKGLLEVVDNIILVGDCKIIPSELDKLKNLVSYVEFERHGQYDFGSYRRGLEYARKAGLLDRSKVDELILINDSCLGPVYPFSELFEVMSQDKCDFWGYSSYEDKYFAEHLSSYFIVFKRPIIDSLLLDSFLHGVRGKLDRDTVIGRFESKLTPFLIEHGFYYSSIAQAYGKKNNIFFDPLIYIETYRIPIIKKKALSLASSDDASKVVGILESKAPELVATARHIMEAKPAEYKPFSMTLSEHRSSFRKKEQSIIDKVKNNQCIRVVFIVMKTESFAGKQVFEDLYLDSKASPQIVVVPDFTDTQNVVQRMDSCYRELIESGYSVDSVSKAEVDEFGRWQDVCESADIVVYSTPYYEKTSFRYSPYYSVGRQFLPVILMDDDTESAEDIAGRLDVFDYMWSCIVVDQSESLVNASNADAQSIDSIKSLLDSAD